VFSIVNTEAKNLFSSSLNYVSDKTSKPLLSINGPTEDLTLVFDRAYV